MSDSPRWVTSTYSASGNCVQVTVRGDVPVRDTKDRQGAVLRFAPEAWRRFAGPSRLPVLRSVTSRSSDSDWLLLHGFSRRRNGPDASTQARWGAMPESRCAVPPAPMPRYAVVLRPVCGQCGDPRHGRGA